MTLTLYGIPNCDTVKQARCWLNERGQTHTFHDFKKQGVPGDRLPRWMAAVGLDTLVNRRGPTFRRLDADVQAALGQPTTAPALMAAHSSVIKRPVVEWPDGSVTAGFDAVRWAGHLK